MTTLEQLAALEHFAALRSPAGETALAIAAELLSGRAADPLAAASALRGRGFEPGLAAAALTQAELRGRAEGKFGRAEGKFGRAEGKFGRAEGKFGADAARMFFTRAGLEQATRSAVANRRAARLAAAGVRTLADLGCGIGADALAAARAGIKVYAVEADPLTAEVARANATALGLDSLVSVHIGDATEFDVTHVDAVFCDPARRRTGSGRRVFDPTAFSPPWDFVAALAARVPRTVLKLAPGIDHALIPPGAEAEWVSMAGEVVEAAFWCGPLAQVPRRATLLPGLAELSGTGEVRAPVGPVKQFLFDPDGAVVRAHLVAEFAETIGGTLADPDIAYVYADQAADTPYARCFEVIEVLPFSLKRLRAALRARGVTRVEIRKRGSAVDVEQLRRDLRLSNNSGNNSATVVLTRVANAPTALICR